jgi:rubrerythrin
MTDDEIYHLSNNPPTYRKDDDDHSSRAIYTCDDCGAKHKGWKPDECIVCGCEALDWSFAYGYRGRFA